MNRRRPSPTRHLQIILNFLSADTDPADCTRLDRTASKPDWRSFQQPRRPSSKPSLTSCKMDDWRVGSSGVRRDRGEG